MLLRTAANRTTVSSTIGRTWLLPQSGFCAVFRTFLGRYEGDDSASHAGAGDIDGINVAEGDSEELWKESANSLS